MAQALEAGLVHRLAGEAATRAAPVTVAVAIPFAVFHVPTTPVPVTARTVSAVAEAEFDTVILGMGRGRHADEARKAAHCNHACKSDASENGFHDLSPSDVRGTLS